MKKILSFVLAAVALVFTACSNDETIETSGNGQNNKGMVLVATVSQQDSRAAIDVNQTSGTWKFTFDDNDNVLVGNKTINNYYTFTKNSDTFSSTDAKTTASPTTWYAYYPGTDIKLTNQEGTAESAAKLYALAGATTTATTGAEGLTNSMKAKAAVLRIVKVDNYGPCDIYLKTADGKYVSGLKAKKNDAGYEVVTSDTKVSVFYKAKEGNAGIYYVIVPAGVKISVYNSDKLIKTTKDPGLKAGNYYTLTSGPTTGTATINGKTEPIGWVQLWIGGPRIATENVAEEIAFKDDVKKGKNYVWGSLWCTPSVSDVSSLHYNDGIYGDIINDKLLNRTYDFKDKHGFILTGKQPGYTKNSLSFSGTKESEKDGYAECKFLLSDGNKEGHGTTINFSVHGHTVYIAHVRNDDWNNSPYPVRPILSQETVLWGEQDIK